MSYDICIVSAKKYAETAKKLADGMRSYRLPKGAVPQNDLDYRNIYLDTDEAPFTEETMALLDDVGYLIVLFSPESKASDAVNDRLVYYEKLTGRESIVPVIVDGEPADIFPDMFIQHQRVSRILPDMSVVEMDETIEPVAADLRGDTEQRRKELLQYETVRITASVLGMHPDDLERRHQRRRRQRIITIVSILGAILLTIAAIFTVLGIRAHNAGVIAEKQARLAASEVQYLTEELPEVFADSPAALKYIEGSIASAREQLAENGLTDYITTEQED